MKNLEAEELGEDLLRNEYEMIMKLKHLLDLKIGFNEWKDMRAKEH
jgi:hypothetical protein